MLANRENFLSYYESVVESVVGDELSGSSDNGVGEAFERARALLRYTVPDGKLTRGLTVVNTYKMCCEDANKETEAFMLGWAVEIMQAFFLIADDIMDHSEMRRGKPCWYKMESVGMDAINDSFFMEQLIYKLLRVKFHSLSCYPDLLDLFHNIVYKTTVGQTLDLITAPVGKPNLDKFSEERYFSIAKNKTAYYTVYLPIVAAVHLSGCASPRLISEIENVAVDLGVFFQVQDDFLDLYGDPAVTGKIGTDIQDNKCSWLIVQALKVCNEEQRAVLRSNYGFFDGDKVEQVRRVFDELDLKGLYAKYEEEAFQKISSQIELVSNEGVKKSFQMLIDKLFKRFK